VRTMSPRHSSPPLHEPPRAQCRPEESMSQRPRASTFLTNE
jgi:hypothetical protein